MDKAEFVELAPQYYALAIALAFASKGGELTRRSIMNEYIVHEEDEDPYCPLDDFTIWNRAIAWLVDRDMILAYTDPFGPPVYNKGDIFDSQFNELGESDRPFANARRSGNPANWTREALIAVHREYIRLGIRPSDFESPERDWQPIPLDRQDEALQAAIVSLDKTITEVEQSNGYASEHAEERNFVLDNLRMLSQRLKGAGTISIAYVRTHGLSVLKRVQDRFVDTAIGEGAKETVKAIVHWLHEIVNYFVP